MNSRLHEVLPKLDGSLQSLSLEDLTRLSQFLHHTYQGNLRATRAYLERLHACWSPTQPLEQVLLQATADRVSRAKQKATEDALFQARSHRP